MLKAKGLKKTVHFLCLQCQKHFVGRCDIVRQGNGIVTYSKWPLPTLFPYAVANV